jgi:hypothetical protein
MASAGHIRVVLALNAALSLLFTWTVMAGLDLIGMVPFNWRTVGLAAAALFVFSYIVAIR